MTRGVPRPAHRPRLERDEQRGIIDCFKRVGTIVYSTSQYRASHVSIGIADLWCVHPEAGIAWWWEVKKYRATADYSPFKPETWVPEPLRPEQQRFAEQCLACQIPIGAGGISEAQHFLVDRGIAQWSANKVTVVRRKLAVA